MKLLIIPTLLILAACTMRPGAIERKIERCEEHDLIPVAIVRNDGVRHVNCLPSDTNMIVNRELQLIKLPKPSLPRD